MSRLLEGLICSHAVSCRAGCCCNKLQQQHVCTCGHVACIPWTIAAAFHRCALPTATLAHPISFLAPLRLHVPLSPLCSRGCSCRMTGCCSCTAPSSATCGRAPASPRSGSNCSSSWSSFSRCGLILLGCLVHVLDYLLFCARCAGGIWWRRLARWLGADRSAMRCRCWEGLVGRPRRGRPTGTNLAPCAYALMLMFYPCTMLCALAAGQRAGSS